jgi:hypothetical protein
LEPSIFNHDVRVINANAFELNSKMPNDSQVGICFIRQTPDGISIISLDSVHQQLYPFINPLPNDISSDTDFNEKMLKEFPDVFSKQNADTLPEHRPYDCDIPLEPGKQVPHGKLYNLTVEETNAMKTYIEENLAKGFIRHSSSPAGAPCFFVKKKDGSLRMCIDYRGLNKITVKNRYALPLIPDLIRTLSKAKVFTTLDLRGAYNLLRVKKGDEWKTAFRSHFGHFEYLVMPFGLTNAPAIFQHMMTDIFRDVIGLYVLVYLDDIIIYSDDPKDHENHVRVVLERLRKYKLYCKLEKCSFAMDTISYLGYVISTTGVSMDPDKVSAVLTWPTPQSVHDIQVFLGFANFYRRFIRNYAKITQPLTALLRKDVKFEWSDATMEAFETLKMAFVSPPVLIHPDTSAPFIVETDASDFALCGVLSQYDNDQHLHPVAFYSRQLASAERNYEIYDRELLAIHESLKEWRHFLQGAPHPVTILCDHQNLEYFTTTRSLNRRQARWYLFLSEFDFVLTHRPGKLNGKADSLSRRPDYLPSGGEDDQQENMVQVIKPSQIMALNFVISEDTSFIDQVRQATLDHQLMKTVDSNKALEVRDGLILKNGLVFVPTEELRLQVMKSRHDGPQAGHFGINKTLELILRDFWWPKMKADIQNNVRSCDCVRSKAPRHKPYGLLQVLPIPERPWSSVSTDQIVELPLSCGFDAIDVWVCRLSKLAHFIANKTTATANDFSENFVNHVFRLHGLPNDIVSDRGSLFMSPFWKKTCEKLGISLNYSTSFHPQTDGQTERVNQTLEQYLRCFVNYNQDNWVKLLPLAEFAYNNSINASTGKSPFLANYGFHPRADLLNVTQQDFTIEYIADGIEDIKATLAEAQKKYKEYADAKRIDMVFEVGDQVWLLSKNIKTTRPSKKLDYRRLGPFKIIQKIGKVAYKLDLPSSMKIHNVFHVSLLEPTIKNKFQGRTQEPPPPVDIEGEEEFEVEEILDSRLFRRHGQYRVHWVGYHVSEATWEPWELLKNAPEKVQEFHDKYPNKPGPWGLASGVRSGEGPTVRADH